MEYLQPDNSINVIDPDFMHEYDTLFGPDPGTPLVMKAHSTQDILLHLKLAPSKTWCRKNNWDKPIQGWFEFTFGYHKYKFYCWMPTN